MARAKQKNTKRAKNAKSKVWERPPPRSATHSHLRPAAKAKAKARAKRAGRRYPNLVDNIRAARGK